MMLKKINYRFIQNNNAIQSLIISMKYGIALAIILFILRLFNFLVLIFPQFSDIVIEALSIGSILIGYFLAIKNRKENFKHEKILSNREIVVFNELLSAKSNQEISKQLFIEVSTLKSHINRIYKKTGVNSRSQLRKKYIE